MCSKENVMKCKSNYTSSYLKVNRNPSARICPEYIVQEKRAPETPVPYLMFNT